MGGLPRLLLAALATTLAFTAGDPARAQSEAKRAITQVAGDLYRFQNNFHFSVFLVTPEGVIATDPINAEAAQWLEAEIESRFGQPIRYLIYSHDHADHSSGGEVFADTATVIAHENTKATIIGEQRPTAIPDITFSDQMTLELGGKSVELTYVGPGHSDNSTVMNFPAERALFAVDFLSVSRLPFRTLSDSYYPGWIDAIRAVEAIDFDILVPGHGKVGVKADVAAHRAYHEDLYNGVLAAAREGQSLEQMQQSLTLDAYKGWQQYDAWRAENIQGMLARVQAQRRGN